MKKVPIRTCVVTKEKLEKKELIRIVRTPLNEVIIDLNGKANGRGSYIKKDLVVLEKAIKSKILEKHLEIEIPEDIYEKLKTIIK